MFFSRGSWVEFLFSGIFKGYGKICLKNNGLLLSVYQHFSWEWKSNFLVKRGLNGIYIVVIEHFPVNLIFCICK